MASLITNKDGRRRIEFTLNDRRRSVWCGRMTKKAAEELQNRVEKLLECTMLNRPITGELAEWAAGLDSAWYDRLANVGLLPERVEKTRQLLGPFLAEYLASRTDAKRSTHLHWKQAVGSLLAYFGKDRPLDAITIAEAKGFARWLRTGEARKNRYADKEKVEGLSPNTVNKRLSDASQFFNNAVDAEILAKNPFYGLGGTVKGNKRRQCFVDRATFQKVLDAAPSNDWRLMLTLARYGGLRVPSELARLTWSDIDWAGQRMTIHASKTEHHADEGIRIVPIFPEIRPYLDAAWDAAEKGAVKVLPKVSSVKNLRTRLLRIINRAGLKPWDKLWQNLRASRATELASEYPSHVCTEWLGHTEKIAEKHYWMLREEDYQRATQGAPHSPDSASFPGVSPSGENPVFPEEGQQGNIAGNLGNLVLVGDEGLERATKTALHAQKCGERSALYTHDADLQRVIGAWPRLAPATRKKILNLLDE